MTNKKSNKKFLIGITAAFVLPLSLYLITKTLSKDKIPVPGYFGVERVDSSLVDGRAVYDTAYHHVADLELVNQLGETVSLNRDLKDKVLVVNFFYADCNSTCPKLTGNMKLLQRAFKKNDTGVHLISITVTPEQDSFPKLRAYAERNGVNHDRWWFLTGDRRAIYNYARHELHVTMQPGDGGLDDFIHTDKIVLIDKDRYVRGYYKGTDSSEVKRCADDIVKVTMQKKRK